MKIRKITLILLAMLLLICSLSTISAANNTISDTDTGGILQGIADTGNGDTLYLNPGTYNKTNQDTNITINKNITIQGNGSKDSVIIDAGGLSGIFTIANNLNVSFINITFINGYSTNGGGIYANSAVTSLTLTFINCTFKNNIANSGGGGIFVYNGNVTIQGSSFINNSVTSPNQNGGGVHLGSATNGISNINISDSIFTNNSANGGGGLFIASGNGTVNANIVNSNFTNNTATTNGGGIYIYTGINGTVNANISDSTITDNNANNYGGGIIINNHINGTNNVNITNSTFKNNTAIRGGGIYITADRNGTVKANISDSTIANNNASDYGGGISVNEVEYGICIVNINKSTFTNNSANYGGAILNNATITLSNNIMSDNVASVLGNVIYNNRTIGILNLTYLSNSTVKTIKGSNVLIYATLTDDMGNTVTGQDISFYVDGVFISNVTSIEGIANITYLVTQDPGAILPVTGDYAGYEGYSINIRNGQLEIPKRNIIVNITIEKNGDGSVTITANATYENDGSPVINHPVEFYLDGELVGTGTTDENGIAILIIPTSKITHGSHTVTVIVRGNNQSNNGIASVEFPIPSNPEPIDPIIPDENNKTNKTSNNPVATAAMKETGIPINLILLVILSCLGIIIRKK